MQAGTKCRVADIVKWINDNGISCSYFWPINEYTFEYEEDAFAFALLFDGKPGGIVTKLIKLQDKSLE